MAELVYHVVQHDGGWAYKVDGSFSETFPTHEAAHRAAARAAAEQRVAGDTTAITYEDARGEWKTELASGEDRPDTSLDD
jgi:hypothetical protein